jgi:hypothetical protein
VARGNLEMVRDDFSDMADIGTPVRILRVRSLVDARVTVPQSSPVQADGRGPTAPVVGTR